KDRLYITGKDSLARRSAQTALYQLTQALLKLLAPILSFTAEEAWKALHGEKAGLTIFTELFQPLPDPDSDTALMATWERLRNVRAEVMRSIEEVRSAGNVGSSLAAEIDIYASGADYEA